MTRIDRDDILRLAEEYGGAWGMNHTRRLLRLIDCMDINHDRDVMWVAAYLHDWGAYDPWKVEGIHHAVRGREVAEHYLREHNYADDFIARVCEVIEFHHDPDPNRSIEAILLCDADALDFLGSVGVLRNFARFPRDMRRAYDDIKRRRTMLPDGLILPEAKALAAERLPIMDQLLATFEAETFGLF